MLSSSAVSHFPASFEGAPAGSSAPLPGRARRLATAGDPDRGAMANGQKEAPDLRAGGWGAWVPLEFRGASGALDTEHKDRNLPAREIAN
jgi:hypothetical protein